MTTPDDDLTPINDVEFEEFEDDPMWEFRAGGSVERGHEVQGRHRFCGAILSLQVTQREFDRCPDVDALIGELVDTLVEKHTPCPVLAARVKQITIG